MPVVTLPITIDVPTMTNRWITAFAKDAREFDRRVDAGEFHTNDEIKTEMRALIKRHAQAMMRDLAGRIVQQYFQRMVDSMIIGPDWIAFRKS